MTTPKGRMPVRDALERLAREAPDDGREHRVRKKTEFKDDGGVTHEKFVEVEFIGEPPITSDPVVMFKLAIAGQKHGFTAHQAAVIRATSRIRKPRSKTKVREVLRRHGFSRDYYWTAKNRFIQRMTFEDATRLKATPDGHEFRVLGQEEAPTGLVLPQNLIRVTSDVEMREVLGYIRDPRKPNVRNA
jgi:hypothetical protein